MSTSEETDILVKPQCFSCKYYVRARTCAAYPDETIPYEIIKNKHDHRIPYPGDRGILFQQS